MDHGGEAARQTTAASTELGMADAVQGSEANIIASGTLDGQLGAVAAPPGSFSNDFDLPGVAYPSNGVVLVVVGPQLPDGAAFIGHLPGGSDAAYDDNGYYALQLRQGAGHGDLLVGLLPDGAGHGAMFVGLFPSGGGAVRDDYGNNYVSQPRPGAGRGELLVDQLPDGAGHGELFVGLLPSGGGVAVHADYGYYVYVSQPRPDAERGELLVDLLPDGAGHGVAFVGHLAGGGVAAYDDYGYYALQPRPGAGHGEVLVGLLLDGAGHGEVFLGGQLPSGGGGMVYNWDYALQPRPDARSGEVLRGPNLSEGHDNLRRLLPLAGIGASSVAINGLAAGPGSPAVAFHLFVLLLGGLFLVILHVLRV